MKFQDCRFKFRLKCRFNAGWNAGLKTGLMQVESQVEIPKVEIGDVQGSEFRVRVPSSSSRFKVQGSKFQKGGNFEFLNFELSDYA